MAGGFEDEPGKRSDGFDAGAFALRKTSSMVLQCYFAAHGVPPLFAGLIAREFVNAILGPPSRTERLLARGISGIEYWDGHRPDAHDHYREVPDHPGLYRNILGADTTANRVGHSRSRENLEVNRDDHGEISDGTSSRGARIRWGGLSRSREDLEVHRGDSDMGDCR